MLMRENFMDRGEQVSSAWAAIREGLKRDCGAPLFDHWLKPIMLSGIVTNAHDRDLLVSAQARDSLSEGILAAVKRLYLLGKNDRPTGTFTFAELLAHERSVEQSAGRAAQG